MSACYIPEFVVLDEREIAENASAALPAPTRPMEHPGWVSSEDERKLIQALTALPYPLHRIWLRPPNELDPDSTHTFGLIVSGIFTSRKEEAAAWEDVSQTAESVAGRLEPATQVFDERDLAKYVNHVGFLEIAPNWVSQR